MCARMCVCVVLVGLVTEKPRQKTIINTHTVGCGMVLIYSRKNKSTKILLLGDYLKFLIGLWRHLCFPKHNLFKVNPFCLGTPIVSCLYTHDGSATLRALSQFWSFEIRRMTFLNYIKCFLLLCLIYINLSTYKFILN